MELRISVFPCIRVEKPYIALTRVIRMAWPSTVVIEILTGLTDFVRACTGERVVPSCVKGCIRSLMRAVSFVLSRSTYLVGCACVAKYCCPTTR